MKTVTQRILMAIALAALLPSLALPMKRTFDQDHSQHKKQKREIKIPHEIVEMILSFIVNNRGFVILTKEIKTLPLTSQAFNTKLSEMMHEPFQLLIQSNSSEKNMLSPIDADKLCSYLDIFFNKIITTTSINEEAFSILNKFIKNNHARRLFASQLISRLRTIICQANHLSIKTIFNSLQQEDMLKWAIRFVYNEVMCNTDTPLIDNNDVVDIIRIRINKIQNKHLDLSLINEFEEFGQQLQKFLMHAHELIEPLCSQQLNCPHLLILYLHHNKLVNVPDFNLPHLLRLDLIDNQLIKVPDFSNMPNLQALWLYKNRLETVPDFNLPHLIMLDLFYNKLEMVPDFSNLLNLQELNLSQNQLETVPDFSNLLNLQELNLSQNQLETVPDFSNLPNLLKLNLWNNQKMKQIKFTALPNNCDIKR